MFVAVGRVEEPKPGRWYGEAGINAISHIARTTPAEIKLPMSDEINLILRTWTIWALLAAYSSVGPAPHRSCAVSRRIASMCMDPILLDCIQIRCEASLTCL